MAMGAALLLPAARDADGNGAPTAAAAVPAPMKTWRRLKPPSFDNDKASVWGTFLAMNEEPAAAMAKMSRGELSIVDEDGS
jgi:hypothetical protein